MADLNLDKFLKVLNMTTTDNDGVAINAMRAANRMLREANVDWDKLIKGKVTVVADPFSAVAATKPTAPVNTYSRPQAPSPPRKQYTRPQPTAKPQPIRPHNYCGLNQQDDNCLICNKSVGYRYGHLYSIVVASQTKYVVLCTQCDNTHTNHQQTRTGHYDLEHEWAKKHPAKPTRAPRNTRKVSINDLMFDELKEP